MTATASEISEDFDSVSKQPAAMRASFYRGHVKLSLADDKIDRLTEQHIDSFHGELRVIYRSFDQYPSSVRLALFDMIFNLGATRLRTGWPSLNKAIAKEDWVAAAAESRRAPPVSPTRNTYVQELFLTAAREAELTP